VRTRPVNHQTMSFPTDTDEPAAQRMTLTVEEAASVLGVGRTLAYQMAREGRLPVIRLGRRLLVSRSALEHMLEGEQVAGEHDQ
jgi:excisionase family DNA binding protein